MNFLVKHVIANLITAQAFKAATLGIQTLLVKYSPDEHTKYVDEVIKFLDTKTDKFIIRNAALRQALLGEGDPAATSAGSADFKKFVSQIQGLLDPKDITDEK